MADGEFIEHAEVHGNLYGTSKASVREVRLYKLPPTHRHSLSSCDGRLIQHKVSVW